MNCYVNSSNRHQSAPPRRGNGPRPNWGNNLQNGNGNQPRRYHEQPANGYKTHNSNTGYNQNWDHEQNHVDDYSYNSEGKNWQGGRGDNRNSNGDYAHQQHYNQPPQHNGRTGQNHGGQTRQYNRQEQGYNSQPHQHDQTEQYPDQPQQYQRNQNHHQGPPPRQQNFGTHRTERQMVAQLQCGLCQEVGHAVKDCKGFFEILKQMSLQGNEPRQSSSAEATVLKE